jgi:hypothetical protein
MAEIPPSWGVVVVDDQADELEVHRSTVAVPVTSGKLTVRPGISPSGVWSSEVLVWPAAHPSTRRARHARVLIEDHRALLDAHRADVHPVSTSDDVHSTIRTPTEGAVHQLVPLRHARTVSASRRAHVGGFARRPVLRARRDDPQDDGS